MFRLLPIVGLFVLAIPCAIQGQPAQKNVPAPKAPGGEQPDKDVDPDGKGAKDAKGPKESPRMQKLKQLSFDRRPSAIFKAWSKGSLQVPDKKEDSTEKEKQDPATQKLEAELAELQLQVTLGKWGNVKSYFATLPKDEAQAGYKHLLESLAIGSRQGGEPMEGMNPQMMQFAEKNKFSPTDVIGLAAAAPTGVDKDTVAKLGSILSQAIAGGHEVDNAVQLIQAQCALPKDQAPFNQRQAAQLLAAANQAVYIGTFLPSLDEAVAKKDHEALNLLARHFSSLYQKEKKTARLEQAWAALQAVLSVGGGPRAEIEEGLKRAVEIAPKLREELGQKWLEQSFTSEPQRGMDIVATIGTAVARGMQSSPMQPDQRFKALQLQKTAVEALVRAAPDKAASWQTTLSLLTVNWLTEAQFSAQHDRSNSLGPRMQFDRYGNSYYMNDDDDDDDMPHRRMMMQREENMPQPVPIGKMLDTRPSETWLAHVEDGLKPKLVSTMARQYLKVKEETKAFPYIEQLAKQKPEEARELVKEFLRVWTSNHNLNESRQNRNPYFYIYGFDRQGESIPLTRSKQERNLVELAEWTKRLRALGVGEMDEVLLAKAFTTCHSSAEVYRMDAIQTVFGPLAALKPKTL
jgi:hypothetical protein